MHVLTFVVVILCYRGATSGTIVVQQTTNQRLDEIQNTSQNVTTPQIYKFHVISDINYRYARTVVSSRVANPTNTSQEVFFTAVLPDTAFISGFLMEIDGHIYRAYVREKEAAKQEYREAVSQGRTAAHVALSSRDSNRFRVSLNLEPQKEVAFNLTYEELLSRKLGAYKQIINLDPGQIVQDFKVQVNIEESTDIVRLNVPALRTSNEINANPETGATNPLATIDRPSPREVVVKFTPTPNEQRDLARDGIKGHLIIEYDVDRKAQSGEILVNDGYFVHFFAPTDLPSLKKQVTFVLDVSGSMTGHKIEQLKQAMTTILDDLHSGDLFSIVIFSSTVQVWDHTLLTNAQREQLSTFVTTVPWEAEFINHNLTETAVAAATSSNINKAKEFIRELPVGGATNIHGALMKALEISKLELHNNPSNAESNDIQQDSTIQKPEPIIIFLTDGQANVGIRDTNTIVSNISEMNMANTSIFSLALGNDADFNFLKQLSLRNSGFARKIYEASDTALQLRDFYRQVSSPLLANVQFQYPPQQVDQTSVTTQSFRRLFSGSELVVAGKTYESNVTAEVQGTGSSGGSVYSFLPIIVPRYVPASTKTNNSTNTLTLHTNGTNTMERLWAYLTIQQLLDKDKEKNNGNTNSTEKQQALELALRYSFVTPLTSLVVVKPNGTEQADTSDPDGGQHRPTPGLRGLGSFGGTSARTYLPSFRSFPGQCPLCYRGNSGRSSNGFSQFASMQLNTFLSHRREGLSQRRITMFPQTTTTMAPTTAIVALDDIIWLPLYSSNTTIALPTGSHDATEYYQLATANQTNEAYSNCTAPTGDPGHCRHLRYCVLNVFIRYRSYYMPYFCSIGNFAGVCCPDHLILPTLN